MSQMEPIETHTPQSKQSDIGEELLKRRYLRKDAGGQVRGGRRLRGSKEPDTSYDRKRDHAERDDPATYSPPMKFSEVIGIGADATTISDSSEKICVSSKKSCYIWTSLRHYYTDQE
jgi:hypothetical protein